MKKEIEQKNKIIKSFFVVGLNPAKLNNYNEENDEEKAPKYIENIDILIKKISTKENTFNRDNKFEEKWYRVIKDSDTWLRVKFSKEYNKPITDFKIIGCNYDDTGNFILLEKKHINEMYFPIEVTYIEENSENKDNNDNEENTISVLSELNLKDIKNDKEEKKYIKIPKKYDLKKIMNLPVKKEAGVILVTREYNNLPLKNFKIQYIKNSNSYQFIRSKNKNPFSNKFTPEVLDQYPQSDLVNNSVSMFCFPEGIKIIEKRKEPTKFNFVLTDEIGERTYGSCLIFWEKLNNDLRREIKPIYEEMIEKTNEEMEEEKNKQIKEIKKYKLKDYYVPKAICILSKFPFFSNCILFLKELYKIYSSSSTLIPLERAICAFVDSLYKQSYSQLIRFPIQKENIDFYFIPNYGKEWDINDQYLETLFRVLNIDIILTAWQGLLLEKKLFLICSSKETLLQVAHGFITLLFPFKWIHTYIPILPEKLKAFTESPMPLIFGIPFEIKINDLPDDGLIININKNCFENYKEIPKLSGKLKTYLEKKLNNLKQKYKIENPVNTDEWMDYLDAVEPIKIPENANTIDCGEIRDAFYEVFIQMFKNVNKYLNLDKFKEKNNEQEEEENEEEQIEFKREVFLRDLGSTDDGSFLSMFCDTTLFSQFISSIPNLNQDSSTHYFFECIQKGKGKNKVYLPNIIPKEIVMVGNIKIDDLNKKEFFYSTFPKLKPSLFIHSQAPIKPYKSKFIFQKDEWCYNPLNLKKKDWPKYFLYLIYEIWYNFFSISIHLYEKEKRRSLMDYALFLLDDLIKEKKIKPTRNLFSKLFKACGRNDLSSYTKRILSLANHVYSKSGLVLFQNEYLNGFYALAGYENAHVSSVFNLTNSVFTVAKQNILDDINSNNLYNFEDDIFLTEKYCPFCTTNINKIKLISIEEILSGFSKKINILDTICPNCMTAITPEIYYLNKNDKQLNVKKFNLLTPFKIINEIDNNNQKFGEFYFYLNNKPDNYMMDDVYKSIVFYFKLFDLPLFVLYIIKDEKIFEKNILKEIEDNILRKTPIKRKGAKNPVSPNKHSRAKSPDAHLDISEENKSTSGITTITGDSFSAISGKSDKSSGSILEKELWKDIVNKNKDKIKLTGDKICTENRSDLLKRIKYMKSVMSNITAYFVSSFKEKLEEFLVNGGFYSDIKENESISTKTNTENNDENPFHEKNKIHKGRPQSCDRKKYEVYGNNNKNDDNKYLNYNNNAFDAIIQENREDNTNDNHNKRKSIKIPIGFNQIKQLNDPNDIRSRGFGSTIKKIFSFGTKKHNNNINKENK